MTAKNFISFRINITPFLQPDVTPPAVATQPSPATSDPLHDWEKGVKPDMSIRRSDLTINDGEDDALQFSGANEADYNIDSDPMTLMANAHRQRELSANRVLMHCEQWKGMSPKGQEIWDQHSDEDKAVMLSKPATVMTRRDQPSNECEPSSHKVNVHDATVCDSIVANMHLLDYEEATDDAEDDAIRAEIDESNDEGDQNLHAFLASCGNNPSPADVHNVLLTSLRECLVNCQRTVKRMLMSPTPWTYATWISPDGLLIMVPMVV